MTRPGDEKQWRTTRAGERSESSGRLVVRFAIVDDDGEAELVGQGELCVEEAALLLRCREATDRVEAGLAHRDRLRMSQELAELGEALGLGLRGLVRVDPEGGMHALVALGDRERRPARLDAGADRDDSGDAGCLVRARSGPQQAHRTRRDARASRSRRCGGLHPRELVGDHLLGVELREQRLGSRSVCPAGSALGSHRPVHDP